MKQYNASNYFISRAYCLQKLIILHFCVGRSYSDFNNISKPRPLCYWRCLRLITITYLKNYGGTQFAKNKVKRRRKKLVRSITYVYRNLIYPTKYSVEHQLAAVLVRSTTNLIRLYFDSQPIRFDNFISKSSISLLHCTNLLMERLGYFC